MTDKEYTRKTGNETRVIRREMYCESSLKKTEENTETKKITAAPSISHRCEWWIFVRTSMAVIVSFAMTADLKKGRLMVMAAGVNTILAFLLSRIPILIETARMKILSSSIPKGDQIPMKPYFIPANNPAIVPARITVKRRIDIPVEP
ncbi:MAG: hypothetical protein WC294_07585 [Methanoregula sp.]|jgi:hypothetical protein